MWLDGETHWSSYFSGREEYSNWGATAAWLLSNMQITRNSSSNYRQDDYCQDDYSYDVQDGYFYDESYSQSDA